MKASIRILVVLLSIVLLGLISAIQGFGLLTGSSLADHSSLDSHGMRDFKMKLADALGALNRQKESSPDEKAVGVNGFGSSTSSGDPYPVNSSDLDSMARQNQSSENKTGGIQAAKKSTSFGAGSLSSGRASSQSSSHLPNGIRINNQGAFKGFWSMEASKYGIGSSGIKDRMVLSGDFTVQKSVSLSECW